MVIKLTNIFKLKKISLLILMPYFLVFVGCSQTYTVKNRIMHSDQNQCRILFDNKGLSLVIFKGEIVALTADKNFPYKYKISVKGPPLPLPEINDSKGTYILIYIDEEKGLYELLYIEKDSTVTILTKNNLGTIMKEKGH